MKNIKHKKGQALIIVALALVGLIAIIGLVVDGGNVFLDRRNAQNAADSAALASALERIRGRSDWVATALESAAENGYNNDGETNSVQVYSPPIDGPLVGNTEYIQVVISSNVNTYFLRIVGTDQINNTVEATSRTKSAEEKELVSGTALVSLAPESNCSNKRAFWLHGNAVLDVTGGGVFINSNNQSCAFTQNGNSSMQIKGGHEIRIVGGATIEKPQLLNPSVTIGVGAVVYPPFFMPTVTCDEQAVINEDGISMSPGEWDDAFPPQGVTMLDPGTYCLNDGLKITDALSGSDVTLYVQDGDVQINPSASIQLSAPTTDENAGLLLFLPLENNSDVSLNIGQQSEFSGTILAPASAISIKGTSSSYGFHSQILGYTLEINGNIVIVYNIAENLKSLTMPEVQLTE